MSGNSKDAMLGKDFISVHQVHCEKAVMGTVQMRFGRNPVEECTDHGAKSKELQGSRNQ